jgi:hypothetical protein
MERTTKGLSRKTQRYTMNLTHRKSLKSLSSLKNTIMQCLWQFSSSSFNSCRKLCSETLRPSWKNKKSNKKQSRKPKKRSFALCRLCARASHSSLNGCTRVWSRRLWGSRSEGVTMWSGAKNGPRTFLLIKQSIVWLAIRVIRAVPCPQTMWTRMLIPMKKNQSLKSKERWSVLKLSRLRIRSLMFWLLPTLRNS